jgi:perosamine synthetase
MRRRQLPVASPMPSGALLRAWGATMLPTGGLMDAVTCQLAQRFQAQAVALTDSGTSALVLALRLAAGIGGTVAFPAYVCVDLIAAARYARVRVRLYDVEPRTLSPDLASLQRVLSQGVDAVVVAHLYGFPADVPGVRDLIALYGIPLIEDAAQYAGATLVGDPVGTFGDLAVLSFGRGKGITSGNGGALLAPSERFRASLTAVAEQIPAPRRGIGDVVGATASWMLGRPGVYDIPASIPALHLGETVYHEAHEPKSLSRAAATLLHTTLQSADQDAAARRQIALALLGTVLHSTRLRACTPIAGGEPGYLRFPVLADAGIAPVPALGIVRSYPRPLFEEPELQPILCPTHEPFTGARELANTLLTLPTHHMVTAADLRALQEWLRA